MCVSAFFSKNFPPVHKNPPLRRFRSRKEAGALGELVVDKALCARAVETYGDMVLRLAFQRLGSQADAEEAAQEVFLKLLREKRFQDEVHLKRWLVRVTLHRCADLRRSAWRRHTVPLETTAWPAFSPEERETLEELWSLPPKDRDVLYLHYYEGYTIAETAELLGEKANTVGARLGRARKKLKLLLEEGMEHG